jgi:Flp pilus assembly protein TadG
MIINQRELFTKTAKRFRGRNEGIAAVEFALIVPFLLVLFVGVSQIGQAVAVKRKVIITTHTITDLITQYTSLSSSNVDTMLAASSQVLAPYPSSNLTLTVSEISTDAYGNATVTWSRSLNGTPLVAGQVWILPSVIVQPNTSYIYGQAVYNYIPIMGYTLIKSLPLTDQLYMSPRLSGSITCSGC